MANQTQSKPTRPTTDRTVERLLEAWRSDDDPAWAELMAAWLQAPAAPRSTETVSRLIKYLDSK